MPAAVPQVREPWGVAGQAASANPRAQALALLADAEPELSAASLPLRLHGFVCDQGQFFVHEFQPVELFIDALE